jgi:hypothetical protein
MSMVQKHSDWEVRMEKMLANLHQIKYTSS